MRPYMAASYPKKHAALAGKALRKKKSLCKYPRQFSPYYLSRTGTAPFHSAPTPSFATVLFNTSRAPLYIPSGAEQYFRLRIKFGFCDRCLPGLKFYETHQLAADSSPRPWGLQPASCRFLHILQQTGCYPHSAFA